MDERGASWKVLLPVMRPARVLALGVSAATALSLARCASLVEWIPFGGDAGLDRHGAGQNPELVGRVRVRNSVQEAEADYDVVVLGNAVPLPSGILCDVADWLKADGTLVVLSANGSTLRETDLLRAGFTSLRHYAALPQGNPRVFLPTWSRRVRARGLAFHAPASRRARWLMAGARLLNWVGVRRHLSQGGVLFAERGAGPRQKPELTSWLSKRLGFAVMDLIVCAGSDSPRRKITALAVTEASSEAAIIKLADTPQGAEAIRQESVALEALSDSPVAADVPELLFEDVCQEYTVQAQSVGSGRPCSQRAALGERHLDFLAELARLGRTVVPLGETPHFRSLAQALRKADLSAWPHRVGECARRCVSGALGEHRVMCHRTHGDFVPWNIKQARTRFFVFDWEESRRDGLALTDVFHFIYRQAALVGPWRGSGRVAECLRDAATHLARRAGYGQLDLGAILRAWLVHEYLARPSRYLDELAGCFGGGVA